MDNLDLSDLEPLVLEGLWELGNLQISLTARRYYPHVWLVATLIWYDEHSGGLAGWYTTPWGDLDAVQEAIEAKLGAVVAERSV